MYSKPGKIPGTTDNLKEKIRLVIKRVSSDCWDLDFSLSLNRYHGGGYKTSFSPKSEKQEISVTNDPKLK